MSGTEKVKELLNRSNILIKDHELALKKILSIRAGGASKLQVLADFDYTCSHLYYNGERMSSSFGALEKYSGLSNNFREATTKLRDHYYPLEVDPTIEKEEKTKLMTQWFTESSQCIIKEGITMETVRTAASASTIQPRAEFSTLVRRLNEDDVPLLIFSAGIGQVISEVLTNSNIPMDRLKIIANEIEFGPDERATQFKPPLITTGNKSKVAMTHIEYFNSCRTRTNALLLGDNIEDVQMSACVDEQCDNVLTIGYLNDRVEDRKDLYMNRFDLVILNDPDMSEIIDLYNLVTCGDQSDAA